jgi:hypothetical protein
VQYIARHAAPRHAHMVSWAPDGFDPEAFDVEAHDAAVRKVR